MPWAPGSKRLDIYSLPSPLSQSSRLCQQKQESGKRRAKTGEISVHRNLREPFVDVFVCETLRVWHIDASKNALNWSAFKYWRKTNPIEVYRPLFHSRAPLLWHRNLLPLLSIQVFCWVVYLEFYNCVYILSSVCLCVTCSVGSGTASQWELCIRETPNWD